MAPDEPQIDDLIRCWAAAVHTGDMDTVLRDQCVPPPRGTNRNAGSGAAPS